MRHKFVGLSLSFCVRDILAGIVSLDDIAFIVPGFSWHEGKKPSESYYETYWNQWPRDEIDRTIAKLKFVPKEGDAANISRGHWMNFSDFSWEAYHDHEKRVRTPQRSPWNVVDLETTK